MKKNIKPAAPVQAAAAENRDLFMMLLRDSLRSVAEQMLLDEVSALCGPSHYPQLGAIYRRAGTEAGVCHAEGRRDAILRPRVRRRGADGGEREHMLTSYEAMRNPANNAAAVVTALRGGMSTRSQAWAGDGAMSKSAASRHWIEATAAKVAELRERDLRGTEFFGLLLGTLSAAIFQGRTLPVGETASLLKGGWLGVQHTFVSSMAQNFWMAIFAFSGCFLGTLFISLATAPNRTDDQLRGLVYSLTEIQHDRQGPWYARPVPLGVMVLGATLVLNIIFW